MPGDQPFLAITGSTAGKSVTVVFVSTSSVAGVVDVTGGNASSLMVTNTSSVTLYARMTQEAVPLATSLDVPMPPNSQRVFASPNPTGKTGVAVTASLSTGGSGFAVFTPGNAGIE